MIEVRRNPNKLKKAWGYELIIENNEKYCGKILHFNAHSKFSLHFHMKKDESWLVKEGKFILKFIDTDTADIKEILLKEGDVVNIKHGTPHQLITETGGDIFEVSTQHFDNDSYRIMKGDSQQ